MPSGPTRRSLTVNKKFFVDSFYTDKVVVFSFAGVVHQDDLQYLFYMSFGFPFFNRTDPETKMVEKMTAMWVNFAKTGEPIPKNNDLFKGVLWSSLDWSKRNYLEIGKKLTMKSNMYPDRYALWERLFPLAPVAKE